MADALSHSSVDSTGEEFVVVNAEPKLRIPNNGDAGQLEAKMSEVLRDDKGASSPGAESIKNGAEAVRNGVEPASNEATNMSDATGISHSTSSGKLNPFNKKKGLEDVATVGVDDDGNTDSVYVFHSALAADGTPRHIPGGGPLTTSLILDNEAVIFTGVTYLGSATVNAPRSELEINRNMTILNANSQMSIPIVLSVPSHSEGTVVLLDPANNIEIASYKIHRILFCARGPTDTKEKRCFGFTCSHGDSPSTAIFQCHVFRCDTQEAQVSKILYTFATAFRRSPKTPVGPPDNLTDSNFFRFNVALEFKEEDGKGSYSTCPKDKSVFKLRCDLEKKLIITVTQVNPGPRELKIERCFGLLISPGRNVKNNEMHLIDIVSMGAGGDSKTYIIAGTWDPIDPSFQILNTETPKDTRVFMTVAVDLVMEGIQEPVRFLVETKAKIYPTNERFWYFSTKPHNEQFTLVLKELENGGGQSPSSLPIPQFEVVSIESQTEIDKKKKQMALTFSPNKHLSEPVQTPQDDADNSDGDEPLLSGSGVVSKDVKDGDLLESWHEALTKWHQSLSQRPRQVPSLVKKGVPEALRGEVWQLLAGCIDNHDMLENYRILITKDSPCDQVILRDINRTFPAHDYFKESGGVGQDSLHKISKAYSVYDTEIGYCQGLSFLAAALLLHMPEEQAFCVLVKVMFDYGLRDLFKQGFEELHLKFYQLERLMQDQMPDLYDHFMDLNLEAHMFASQWFLTLFTAKFPLFMVFHILDLFLLQGMDTIFSVALALLKMSRKDLLSQDFEGVLKYFRVQLPKKYRSEENAGELIAQAISLKVSSKKLKKYEKEYIAMKEAEIQQEDPIERMERENQRLMENNIRLEQENDDLAHELVSSKIALRNDLDTTEDKCEVLTKELLQTKSQLLETEEEKKRLTNESQQVKEMCRRELERLEADLSRNVAIVSDYKQICSQLSERLEKQQNAHKEELARIKSLVQPCESCTALVCGTDVSKTHPLANADVNPELVEKDRMVRELELELAQTKLALVESECKTQDLTHQLNAAVTEINSSKNTWFQKTLTSIKEATVKKGPDKPTGDLPRKEST